MSTVPGQQIAEYPHQELTGQIIAAAYEVYRELGGGFLEKVYQNALMLALRARGLLAIVESEIAVRYKDQVVGMYYADIFVDGTVICEIKAVQAINGVHQAQLLHYLKATGTKVGLLLNFGPRRVDVKRLIF